MSSFGKKQGLGVLVLSRQIVGGLLSGFMSLGLALSEGRPAIALDTEALLLLTQPLTPSEISLLQTGAIPADPSWVTANTISQTGLTTPSLWWAKQQFGGKLLTNWLARPEIDDLPSRVDLLVNQQVWTSYNYLDRYVFINQFGRVSKDFGYSTRVFNAQGELLGAYICDFDRSEPIASNTLSSESNSPSADSACKIFLDPSGVGAIRGVGATGALQSSSGGTVR